jgi:excisionase family DNA binding protein
MDFLQNNVLTFEQGCEYLGYKKSYVYKLTSAGILPFSKPNNKSIFFDRKKLESWMLGNPSKSHEERQIEAATYETTKGGSRK